jgi:hypothetical protein
MITEKFYFTIEVRDKNGKLLLDSEGNKQISLDYEVAMLKSNMENELTRLANKLKTFMPNREIEIDVSVFNSISRTYMTMYSYYVNENRFIKH